MCVCQWWCCGRRALPLSRLIRLTVPSVPVTPEPVCIPCLSSIHFQWACDDSDCVPYSGRHDLEALLVACLLKISELEGKLWGISVTFSQGCEEQYGRREQAVTFDIPAMTVKTLYLDMKQTGYGQIWHILACCNGDILLMTFIACVVTKLLPPSASQFSHEVTWQPVVREACVGQGEWACSLLGKQWMTLLCEATRSVTLWSEWSNCVMSHWKYPGRPLWPTLNSQTSAMWQLFGALILETEGLVEMEKACGVWHVPS